MNNNDKVQTETQIANLDQATTEIPVVKPATKPQVDFLIRRAKMSREEAEALTAKQAFQKIASIIKNQRLAKRLPPTEAQLRFLELNNYNRFAMEDRTRAFCSRTISKIKANTHVV